MNNDQNRNNLRTENNAQQKSASEQARLRRPLNDEERRRLEAARRAAMSSAKSGESDPRKRRIEQNYLNSSQSNASTSPQRSRDQSRYAEEEMRKRKKRKKKKNRFNWGIVVFLVLIALVIGVSLKAIADNSEKEGKETETTEDTLPDDAYLGADTTESESESDETDIQTEEETTDNVYASDMNVIKVQNTSIDEGDLILVNYGHEYKKVDSVELANVYGSREATLKVSNSSLSLLERTLRALEKMNTALIGETGCDDLMITSGYRTRDDQVKIWDNNVASRGEDYAKSYVASPGYSEHHTGLAVDLTFFNDDGATIPISDHEQGKWFNTNAANYGFILRYAEDKQEITKIAYEAWHFRYVGVEHAIAISALDMCLEEYLEYLKNFTIDTKLFFISSNGTLGSIAVTDTENTRKTDGVYVYYVPAASGEETEIRIPADAAYKISGNNADGYIVTVAFPGADA